MLRIVTLGFLAVSATAFAQDTSFSTGPQYLMNYGSPLLLHSIETPSLSLSSPPAASPNAAPDQGSGEPGTPAFAGLRTQAAMDRIYWGVPTITAETSAPERSGGTILISSGTSTAAPSRIFDAGVTSILDADSARRSGLPLGDVARSIKANRRPANRLFTNDDIEHLRAH